MKAISLFLLALAFGTGFSIPDSSAFECNVCHSKNPAMVKMHSATQARGIGCFDCHKVGENLMGKARQKDLNSLMARRGAESPCLDCHGKEAKK
jgi:hypothetical protein